MPRFVGIDALVNLWATTLACFLTKLTQVFARNLKESHKFLQGI